MVSFQGQHGTTCAERFIAKIHITESCHLWCGGLDKDGYGVFHTPQGQVRAHRYALEQALGRPLAQGMMACHSCDTPACVRADHLFEGTAAVNNDDKAAKGRTRGFAARKGVDHTRAKLRRSDYAKIQALAGSHSQAEIANLLNVNQSTISRALRRSI